MLYIHKSNNVSQRTPNFQRNPWEIKAYSVHVWLEELPVGLDDFKHHVVLEVLHKVEHSLAKCKRRRVPSCRVESEQLCWLVTQPDAAFTQRQWWQLCTSAEWEVQSNYNFQQRFPTFSSSRILSSYVRMSFLPSNINWLERRTLNNMRWYAVKHGTICE